MPPSTRREAAPIVRTRSAVRRPVRPEPRSPVEPAPPIRTELPAIALAVAWLALLLAVLHARAFRLPFVSDDYVFLVERARGLAGSLSHAYTEVPAYFRPVGRELWFWAIGLVAGANPLAFHLANFIVLVVTLALVALIGGTLAGRRAGMLAAGACALVYSHRVTVGYASCSQDLLATALGCAAVLLHLRGRRSWAGGAMFLGLLAKESVATLPLVMLAWEGWSARGRKGAFAGALRRCAPWGVALAAWALLVPLPRHFIAALHETAGNVPIAGVAFDAGDFARGMRLALLACAGIEQPWRGAHPPLPASALDAVGIAMAALFPWITLPAARRGARAPAAVAEPRAARASGLPVLAVAWTLLGALPVAVVGIRFSAYYVSFLGVGFALLVASLLARRALLLSTVAFALLASAGVRANLSSDYRVNEEDRLAPAGVSIYNYSRLQTEAGYVIPFREFLLAHRPPRGATIYLSQVFGFNLMGTGGESGPRVWLEDPTLRMRFVQGILPAGDPGPKLFVRVELRPLRFAVMSDSLVLLVSRGEEAMRAGQAAVARDAYEAALRHCVPVEHDGLRESILENLGAAADKLGDVEGARRYLLRAVELAPESRTTLVNLGALDAATGRYDEAREWLRRVLASNPGDTLASRLLRQVEFAAAGRRGQP